MKTLTDLKRDCAKYEWKLMSNSWFNEIPKHQNTWRKVGRVQTQRFTLLTDKNDDGQLHESWLDFPKAKEIQIVPEKDHDYTIIIKYDCSPNPEHLMIYFLRKIEG